MAIDIVDSKTFIEIPLECIVSKLPVRRLSASGLKRIQEGMKRSGFLDNYPLVVVSLGDGTYQLVDGNHRYEAAKSLGFDCVPCVVKNELTEAERYKLALESNDAAETVVPSTMVTHAEFVWERSEQYTQEEIAGMLGWGIDKVKKYSALKQISPDVWDVIVPTFEVVGTASEDESGTPIVPIGTFTVGLLRSILDLVPEQQLELVKALSHPDKNQRISKGKFNELAKAYQARNEMKTYALSLLGDLGEPYTTQVTDEIYSGAYDSEWIKSQDVKNKEYNQHPKLDKLIKSVQEDWERKNSIHITNGNFYSEVSKIGDKTIDLILTDPPYNIANDREFALAGRSNISQNFGEWDKFGHEEFIMLFSVWACEWYRILRDGGSGYAFTSDRYLSYLCDALEQEGFEVKTTIVWHKTNPAPQIIRTTFQSSVEYIVFFTKGKDYTFNWQGNEGEMHNFIQSPLCGGKERLVDAKKETLHPTQKPVQILKHLMEVSSNRGDMVFDGFAGVGSTGKVAKDLGRKFIGIEQDETFFDAMRRRLTDE
jgi:DNA modification methylase/ParB-like chromosome segregation protein Spo0J